MILRLIIEFTLICVFIYGFVHEDKVIAFEQAVKRIVIGHYRRFKRKMLHRTIDRNRKVFKITK